MSTERNALQERDSFRVETADELRRQLRIRLDTIWSNLADNPDATKKDLLIEFNDPTNLLALRVDFSNQNAPQFWYKSVLGRPAVDGVTKTIDEFVVGKVPENTPSDSYFHDIRRVSGEDQQAVHASIEGEKRILPAEPVERAFADIAYFAKQAATQQLTQANVEKAQSQKKSWVSGLSLFGKKSADVKIGTHREVEPPRSKGPTSSS